MKEEKYFTFFTIDEIKSGKKKVVREEESQFLYAIVGHCIFENSFSCTRRSQNEFVQTFSLRNFHLLKDTIKQVKLW